MPANPPDNDLCQALLDFVADGRFPETDSIVSAEFPAATVSKGLDVISTARAEVENEISNLSREAAPDIDGWISQAKQLHADIERSRVTAREIVIQHEKGQQIQRQVLEAEERVQDLQNEVVFTQTISETFEEVRAIQVQLALAREALDGGRIHEAFAHLQEIETSLETTRVPESSHVFRILSTKRSELRHSTGLALRMGWDDFAKIDTAGGRMTISDSMDFPMVEKLLDDLEQLGLFELVVDSLQKDFLASIMQPILSPSTGNRTLSVEGNTLYLRSEPTSLDVPGVLNAVSKAFSFLQKHLPCKVMENLASKLFPTISSELISEWISPAVPIDIASVDDLENLVQEATRFAENLREQGWQGAEDVMSWSRQVPRLWLNKRRAQSLDEVRLAIIGCSGNTTTVERVEKEQVSKKDEMFAENGADDDWNAGWASDNENKETARKTGAQADDDEDVSAWGLEDEENISGASNMDNKEDKVADDDDVDDAWGWDEENDDDTSARPPRSSKKGERPVPTSMPSHREVTLKEFYEVTDIPRSVLSIVAQQISDGELLAKPENSNTKISASGPALLALPTLIIAMFKATAPLFYPQKFKGGQMLLYNDSMYLAEQLQSFSEKHNMSRLAGDIESVERYGRIAYGKEMHSQRTILSDLLDGCQGFANCSEEPFFSECGNSVSATIDRLRDVHKEWEPILSRSALLQSIGSLLSTIIEKIIIDIEDLSDISDAESQKLVAFCNSVSKLEDLFLADRRRDGENGETTERVPMTAMYVPNWLKFQYLINILESSLADIKFLWNEGELKLEFSVEEVVDLIRALFADSDHRRRAITEIRRNAGSLV